MATGTTEGRLRTWERRYGIPKPGRSDTGRRLYDDDDLAMIRRMVSLTGAGVSAAEAAEAVLAEAASGVIPVDAPPMPVVETSAQVFELVAAAKEFDEAAVERALASGIKEFTWPAVFDRVIFPALRYAGDQWERGDLLPAQEHFLSELLRRRILVEIAAAPVLPSDAPAVILACPPAERHDLGLLGLWLALRLQGVRVVYLGVDVPRDALVAAVEQVRPRAVVLAAVAFTSRPELALAARAVTLVRQSPRVFLAGSAVDAPEGVAELMGIRLPASLEDAALAVATEVHASA